MWFLATFQCTTKVDLLQLSSVLFAELDTSSWCIGNELWHQVSSECMRRCFDVTDMRRMLPYSLSSALMSAVSGMVVTRTGSYRPIMWFGWSVMTLGWGLMIMLDSTSTKYVYSHCRSQVITITLLNSAEKEVYPFIAALGIGCLFQVSLLHHHNDPRSSSVIDPAHCRTGGHAYQGYGY
jgi:hypothetical protein